MSNTYNLELPELFGEEKNENVFFSIFLYIVIFIMLAVIFLVTFLQACRIVGDSMLNTLHDKDDVLVTRYSSSFNTDDIIILDVNEGTESIRLVKRVIAVEGEIFLFKPEGLNVFLYKKDSSGEFKKVVEPYIKEDMKLSVFSSGKQIFSLNTEYTVPENSYLFLGDNRNNSRDSRYYGFTQKEAIIGKVVFITQADTFLNSILNLIFNISQTTDNMQ